MCAPASTCASQAGARPLSRLAWARKPPDPPTPSPTSRTGARPSSRLAWARKPPDPPAAKRRPPPRGQHARPQRRSR
eukprot:12648832-Prorocentrum_lima.AAC.1